MPPKPPSLIKTSLSVLAWPAWRRVLAVLPAVLMLWLAVGWANGADMGISGAWEISPW
jgi:hypothetical protein